MSFVSIRPPPPLSDLVETIWDWDAPAPAHRFDRMLPVATATLIVNLEEDETRVYDDAPGLPCRTFSGAALDAPSYRSFVIDTAEQTRVMGVVFRCGAAAAFFRERMDAVVNDHVGLRDLAGMRASSLRERLLEARDAASRIARMQHWLTAFGGATLPAIVTHAVARLSETPALMRIADLSRETGLSPRRFGSLFREHVGMSPKRFARLQRFRSAVADARNGAGIEWTRIAADCGFYDQPHLVREFREFCGMTPGEYAAARGEYMNHIALA